MRPAALLFDIDGTLITTGGASDRAWHRAFLELHDADVNVPDYTGKGVPDPEVGLECFRGALGREPTGEEMAKLMALRQRYLAEEVESSPGYRVMPGVVELLERLTADGRLVGLITGNTEPAAHIKLARGRSQSLLRLRRLRLGRKPARRRLSQGARPRRDRRGWPARSRRLDRDRRHAPRHRAPVTAPGSGCSASPPASTRASSCGRPAPTTWWRRSKMPRFRSELIAALAAASLAVGGCGGLEVPSDHLTVIINGEQTTIATAGTISVEIDGAPELNYSGPAGCEGRYFADGEQNYFRYTARRAYLLRAISSTRSTSRRASSARTSPGVAPSGRTRSRFSRNCPLP